MIRNINILFLCICALSLQACSLLGVATGTAAVAGISSAQEGGISRAVSDTTIKLKINEAWFKYNVEAFKKLGTTINQGRVLITGVVQNPEHRVEAIRLAWQVPGVKQVINEVRVADSAGVTGFIKDTWITSRLRGSIALNRGVQSINYSIDTVQGVVYLMGVAQNQAELNRVVETARTISGVKQVISYVKLAGEPLAVAKKGAVPVRNAPSVNSEPVQLYNNSANNGASQNPIYNVPQNYGPSTSGGDIKVAPLEDYDVPARSVPDNAPRIEDQYYN